MAGGSGTAPGTPGAGARGGTARPPVVDTRAIADFDEITAVPFTFARHPTYPKAHVHMNSIYSDAFLDIDDLFVARMMRRHLVTALEDLVTSRAVL